MPIRVNYICCLDSIEIMIDKWAFLRIFLEDFVGRTFAIPYRSNDAFCDFGIVRSLQIAQVLLSEELHHYIGRNLKEGSERAPVDFTVEY